MWTRWVLLTLSLVLTLLVATCTRGTPAGPSLVQSGDYTIGEPVGHENLTVFLIHGPDKIKGKTYLTLQEAMEQKKVVVHETGSVNELAIENISDDDVYIQSGDIVKGGRQDRTLQNDFVLAGKSGKVPVASFCVEHGRWSGRGSESASLFSDSTSNLSSKSLKLAAKNAGDQGMVWNEVTKSQASLSQNAGGSVADERSSTSLQLTLENKKVQEEVEAYRRKIDAAAKGQADVVGYAFAINGKLNSVDIYASHALFEKMWEKNLRAAATEAFAERKKDAKWEPVSPAAVKACIEDARNGKGETKDLSKNVKVVSRETQANWSYETYDAKAPNAAAPAHLNILTRDPESEKMLQQGNEPRQQMNPGVQQQRQ